MGQPQRNPEPATEAPLTAAQCLVEFRAALLANAEPVLERYLYRTAPEGHATLFPQLLAAEVSYRQLRGESLAVESYLERFPDFAASIAEVLPQRPELAIRESWEEIGPSDTTREFAPDPARRANAEFHLRGANPVPPGRPLLQPLFDAGPAAPPREAPDRLPANEQFAGGGQASPATGMRPWVGKYRVERSLGKGGFGDVYLCHDPDLDDQVAVKVLRPEKNSQNLLAALRDEGRKSRQLEKKGAQVVPVLETGIDHTGAPFLVMKYCAGGSLRDQIKARGVFPWREAVALVSDLARTLAILHTEDIYHRDIKSQNILLDDRGRPYLADFGLASQISTLDRDQAGYSPGYASPEQVISGSHRIDGRSDLYSLGVVFYELLTGKLPIEFTRGLRGDYERRVSDPGGVIPPVRQRQPSVPAPVAELCERCLVWDRAGRVQTAADLASQTAGLVVDSETVQPTRRGVVLWLTGAVAAAGFFSFSFLSRRRIPDSVLNRNPASSPPALRRWNSRLDEAVRYETHVLDNPDNIGDPQPSATSPSLMINARSTLTYALGVIERGDSQARFTLASLVTLTVGTGGFFLGRSLGPPPGQGAPAGTPLAYRFLALLFERDETTKAVTASLRYVTLDQKAVQNEDDLAKTSLGIISDIAVQIVVEERKLTQVTLNNQPLFYLPTETVGENRLPRPELPPGSHHGVCAIRGAIIHFQDISSTL